MNQKSRTHWGAWFSVLVVCAGIVAGLGYVKFNQIQAAIAFGASFPEPSEAVVMVPAEPTTYRSVIEAVGEVRATQEAEMITELSGRITRVGFAPGETVREGQVLLQLDVREEQAALKALAARLELARQTLARNEKLSQSNLLSAQAADEARAEAQVAEAESARLKIVIDKKTLRAPFDAQTGLDDWQVGEFVQAGQSITTLVGVDAAVWIDFSIPQDRIALARSNEVWLELPGLDAPLRARLLAEEPSVDPRSRMLKLRAIADAAHPALKPGAFVKVKLESGAEQRALQLPATALRRDTFGPHVFVLEPAEDGADGPFRARRREVTVAELIGGSVFIADGLTAGEPVAAEGSFKLRDGKLTFATQIPAEGETAEVEQPGPGTVANEPTAGSEAAAGETSAP